MSSTTVGRLLHALGYRLQALRKSREGTSHPDRNAQFEHINATAAAFLQRQQPVISVDTKKKELVGDFKNAGQEWQPTGTPEAVRVHDFPGRRDRQSDSVRRLRHGAQRSVGERGPRPRHARVRRRLDPPVVDDDGPRGLSRRPTALLITADAGGSNGYRSRAWKQELQRLADDLRLRIHVSHFPPGTSKWNKIEHRLFCHITKNWRGRPLRTFETVVELIGHTETDGGRPARQGQTGQATYPTGRRVTKAEMRTLALHPHAFHGDWNYELRPRPS